MAKANPTSPKGGRGMSEGEKGPYTPRGFVARPGSFDAVVSGTVGKRSEQDKPEKKPEAPRFEMNYSLDSLEDSLDELGEVGMSKREQEQEPARPPRIRPALLSSGYGSNAASKEEDFVIHGQSRCVAGTPVKLASEYENHPEWPWLRTYAGQEGKLVKQVGSGWGWVARFGKMEGTFRVRDGIHMLAYSKASTSHTPRKEPDVEVQSTGEKVRSPAAKLGTSKRVSIKDDNRRGSLIGSLDNATLKEIATRGRLQMHFAPIEKGSTPKAQAQSPTKPSALFKWGRVEGRKKPGGGPSVNPFELSATGPDRTIAFLMQKYHTRDVGDVPTQESMYEIGSPQKRRESTFASAGGVYVDEDGQKVDLTGGKPKERSFKTFPIAPYGGWQQRERPSTARYTSRAPDMKSGVRLRPASAGSPPRPHSGTVRRPLSAREGPGLLRLDLQKMYGGVETESRPSARKTHLFVVDGEPTCQPGAEVRVAPDYEWDALQMFRGHVGKLTRREPGKGWHVYFPALKEEAFFMTSAKQSMLVYNASSIDSIPQPHIYANQVKYSQTRGKGPDAFTSRRFQYQCSAQLSFRAENESGGSGKRATIEGGERGRPEWR